MQSSLISQLLMEMCRRELPARRMTNFDFQNLRSVYDSGGKLPIAGAPSGGRPRSKALGYRWRRKTCDDRDREICLDKSSPRAAYVGAGLKPAPTTIISLKFLANFSKTSRWPGLSGLSCCLAQ